MKLFSQSSKNMIFCEASATFQGSHQMLRLPRLLTLCHVCAALTLRLPNAAPATRKRHACIDSNAPVTQNAKMTSHLVTLKRQTEHFVRDFLNFSDFAGNDSVAVCVCVELLKRSKTCTSITLAIIWQYMNLFRGAALTSGLSHVHLFMFLCLLKQF